MDRKTLFELMSRPGTTMEDAVQALILHFTEDPQGIEAWRNRPVDLGEGIKEYKTPEEMARAIVREAVKDLELERKGKK